MTLETTDAASNASTSYGIGVGDVFHGGLTPGDSDWIAVDLAAGRHYTFAMTPIGALSDGLRNPYLILRDAGGLEVAGGDTGNNAGPGMAATFGFTATTGGTYYLGARAVSGSDRGSYGVSATLGHHASYDTDMAAGVLLRHDLSWNSQPDTGAALSWSFRAYGPAYDAQGNSVAFAPLSEAQRAAVHDALAMYSDVARLSFSQVAPGGSSNDATIRFGAYSSTLDGAGAYAYYPGDPAHSSDDGDVWLNNESVSRTDLSKGSYSFYTIVHELGHAMGLGHPGDYEAAPGVDITYGNSAQFIEDSQQYTVMSYFSGTETTATFPGYPDTLMLDDIYALQQLYSANMTTRAGDTTYGFHSTLAPGSVYDFSTNGDPKLCVWDGGGNDTFDFSGFAGNQVIDLHDGAFSSTAGLTDNVSIAYGAVIENALGGSGNDHIYGNAVDNFLGGGGGDDILYGGIGADTLEGGAGADRLSGNVGNDRLLGGDGGDHLYGNLGADLLGGQGGGDTLNGGAGDDRLLGGVGADLLLGGSMADTLDGGAGNDRLEGDRGADLLRGGGQADHLYGGGGRDVLLGQGGQDTLDGGKGDDRLLGGVGADHLNGGDQADILDGGAGNDRLAGNLGADLLRGGDQADQLFGGGGQDTLQGQNGQDTLHGGAGNDHLLGGAGADLLFGGAGADSFQFDTAAGQDTIGDFDPSVDRLLLDRALVGDGATAATVIADHVTVVGAEVELRFDSGVTVLLHGIDDPGLLDGHILILG
ncbi:M10 family metallopeptidase C-terminal domain-containing protein [Acidimangrovimonas pyrenivorans]|uniref:M10 family metallopeptidase C-terminal domain-containing protein n=1 Tax=Acidimangrovimonas pyrenivorans TaxID=2030798 RepID=A0ABV7AJI1_9RHOB